MTTPPPPSSRGRVLIIAGSDSGGGAGIQADIKTTTMLGGYAMTALTAVTAQNTMGVLAISPLSKDMVDKQIQACLTDIGADCIKTGMLGDTALIRSISDRLRQSAADTPRIIDPVMVATSGDLLVEPQAIEAIKTCLIAGATLVTPNQPEAEHLTGLIINTPDDQARAGEALLDLGAKAALVKGGHLPGQTVVDVLVTKTGTQMFESPRIDTRSTHGTGCTLASAIATYLALGLDLKTATQYARTYLWGAIQNAPGLGQGHGPVKHNWRLDQ